MPCLLAYGAHQPHARQEKDDAHQGNSPGILAKGKAFIKNGHQADGQGNSAYEGEDDSDGLLRFHT